MIKTKKTGKIYIDPLTVPQRREQSHRKAKGRSIAALITTNKPNADDYEEEPPEFIDSDSDPAWTPQADKVSHHIVIFFLHNNFFSPYIHKS